MVHHQLLQESVALTLVSGPDRIDRKAIIASISELVPVENVDSFGNLGDHRTWFITFKSTPTKEEFLKQTSLKVNDQIFSIDKPYRNVKQIRLPNVPASVPDDYIREIVSKWNGIVLAIECETLPRPFDSIKTFVRRIRMKFPSAEAEETVPVSCRIAGPKCQVCNGIGHDDPSCNRRRSYASVAKNTPTTVESSTTPTQIPSRTQTNKKTCRRCKQHGHTQRDCPMNSANVIHESTPTPNGDITPSNATPCIMDNPVDAIDVDSPQLAVTTDLPKHGVPSETVNRATRARKETGITPVMVRRDRQVAPRTTTDPKPNESLSLINSSILSYQRSSGMLNEVESYKAFKEGRDSLKRPLHDDYQPGINEPKKQHQTTSHANAAMVKEDDVY